MDDSTADETPIVLRSGTVTNGMKWKVEKANQGYKIVSFSDPTMVLCTGTEGNQPNEKDSGASALWWIIPTAAAVVLLGGAIAFIALRKKKTES